MEQLPLGAVATGAIALVVALIFYFTWGRHHSALNPGVNEGAAA